MRQPVPFGKYLLLDRISVGGMAEVFKAKSYGVEGFEKIIAIKRILPTMGEDRDFIKMFIDEAKIAGQLAHANICQIFELGRIDGSHFIAMEYIWGKDLLQIQNRLRKLKQHMPISMACFAIAKVLEGLDYAHRKRDPLGRPLEIVHRDCSPQNVLVSYEGEVKVIDFGIAKATSRNSRTMAGVLKGKFGYMSPEQVRGLPLDRRSDIFALGTMLYECLTGERLFQGETDFSTLEKVRNVDVAPPRSINPEIPEAVEKVILKALAKDVEERYQWCSEMLADLQAHLMSQDVVFTAKSVSSWLKEVFAAEIERERQQLEQYKRVGRDGLIQGLPAAEAKLDVVEHLGEAGAPEGDATTLGGPSFDDIEQAAGAAPDVGPAPGSPAARGMTPDPDDEDSGDFGEEAPTEIFGEIGDQQQAPPATPQPSSRPMSQPPATRPPRPPPRPSSQMPAMAASDHSGPMARQPQGSVPPLQPMDGAYVPQLGGYPQQYEQPPYSPQGFGTPPQQQMAMMGQPAQLPVGTPGQMMNAVAQPGQQPGRTVLGVAAPPGVANYSGGYRPSAPQQAAYPASYPQQQYPMAATPYMAGAAQPMQGYPMGAPMAPIDQSVPLEGRKSTLVRDIGIGVGIAALVLLGFLAVKMFVLDKEESNASAPTSTIATVRLSLPAGVSADMYVDDDKIKIGTVSDKQEVPVTAGKRRIKLLGPGGAHCDDTVTLVGGQTTTLECVMYVPNGSAAGSAASSAAAGGAQVAAGSAAKSPETKAPDAVDTKTQKTAETKTQKADTKTQKTADKNVATKDTKDTAPKPPDPVKQIDHVKAPDPAKSPDNNPKPPAGDKADPTKGYLQVLSKPSAKISIDGAETGMSTPITGHTLGLAPGKHKVTFVIGEDRFTYPVTVKAGQTDSISKDLQ